MREPETIKVGHERVFLALSDVHDGETTRSRSGELYGFHAHLALPNLRADTLVHLGPPVEAPLREFFDDLAAHWRGWEGEKTWEAYEGGLTLSCTHDRLGNILVTIELHEFSGGIGWLVRGDVPLDAGQLEQVARDVRRFLRR